MAGGRWPVAGTVAGMVRPAVVHRSIDVPGGTIRSRRICAPVAVDPPLLFLHGGPGGSCDGFAAYETLATTRDIVMFDQLGSRSSTWSGDPAQLWTLERFCREVDAVRTAWELDEVVLVGHSWGGWLGQEYLCRGAGGVVGAVLCDTTPSFPTFAASIERRVGQLSAASRAAISEVRDGGPLGSDAYRSAALEFYSRFVVAFVEDPRGTAAAVFDRQRGTEVFQAMQGADELHADGHLASWDRRGDLGSVRVPTLVVVGEHDHMDPACAGEIVDLLPDAEPCLVEGASHCPHLERPDVLLERVRRWLSARRI